MTTRAPHPSKVATVSRLKDLLSRSKSVAFVNYSGLKVNQATQLRRDIKKSGGEMLIAKNTLFSIASGRPDLKLSGLSAFIFSLQDEIASLKALADFIKKTSIGVFTGGLAGDNLLSVSQVVTLANTPSREASIAKLLYLLNWNTAKLVRTLDAIRASKS